jgi:SAM-dependent methyltransferase
VDRQSIAEALGGAISRRDANRLQVRDGELSERALLRSDGRGAYPVSQGIPILLAPEMFVSSGDLASLDTTKDPYREAYTEMEFYNSVADTATSDVSQSAGYERLKRVAGRDDFPGEIWLDGTYDVSAQEDVYNFLNPIRGTTHLQVGGGGVNAIKFLLAGAQECWLITPMLSEALFASELAYAFKVSDRFRAVVGIAEEMPFRDASFDNIFSGGCMHHTVTEVAFPEMRRILKPGGKFAAIEPWRAPLYGVGIRILGQREQPLVGRRDIGVICRPMQAERVKPMFETFKTAAVCHHGTFTRYGLIALGKFGLQPRVETINRITKFDDRVAAALSLTKHGSSVALLAEND